MANEIYVWGYGNKGLDALTDILSTHPETVAIDTRRFPKGWSAVWARPYLEKTLGDRYRFEGILLGNGAKGEPMGAHAASIGIWKLNTGDWWKLDCWKDRTQLDTFDFLDAGLRDLKATLGDRIPIFFCCEGVKKAGECHRMPVAQRAVEVAWIGFEIVHL